MDKKNLQKIGIIGDGLTGGLVAIALLKLGYPVEIVGKKNVKKKKSIATISLSFDSYSFLNDLGFKKLEKICHPINSIKLYEGNNNLTNPDSIFYDRKNKKPLSYIVFKENLKNEIDAELKKLKVKRQFSKKQTYALEINTVESYENSKKINWDYNENAFTFIIKHKKLLNNSSRQFFLTEGPLAFLPLSETQTSIVWSLSKNSNANKIIQSKKNIENFLNKNFKIYENIKCDSEIESYPLKFNFIACGIAPRKIILGDLAHRIHPIAGQGWNMTVRDIRELFLIYAKKKNYGYDFGDYSLLEEFEKKTKLKNFIFASSIDLIRKVFKFNNPSLAKTRKETFQSLDKFPEFKDQIIKIADQGLSF